MRQMIIMKAINNFFFYAAVPCCRPENNQRNAATLWQAGHDPQQKTILHGA